MDEVLTGMQLTWYGLTACSLGFLLWDLLTNTPTPWVMKLAWTLIILYTGPIGLFVYLLSCRQPLPGTHSQFIAAPWKQAVGSLMHCVAGDATGIIVAAALVHPLGLPNGPDLVIEYVAAFVVGLLIFQALFMLPMLGGHYLTAVRKSFFAEFVSMNMVMVGMVPVMVILMDQWPASQDPRNVLFWSVMSLATLAGALTAYPINSWMVRRGLKHGMMTASSTRESTANTGVMPPVIEHGTHHMGSDQAMPSKASMGEAHHHTRALPTLQAAAVIVGTVLCLAVSVWVTSRVAPLRF